MPKLLCPCGFVHDLSPIPDEAWLTIRDRHIEDYYGHMRAYQDGFNALEKSAEREASNTGIREALKLAGRLYECPECGRILWRKNKDEEYRVLRPDPDAYIEAEQSILAEDLWTCPNCNEQLEPQFARCWKCGTLRQNEGVA